MILLKITKKVAICQEIQDISPHINQYGATLSASFATGFIPGCRLVGVKIDLYPPEV